MIGVLTPYGRNEVTSAAIRVADLAITLGSDVRLIACGRRENNVHPHWDSRVLTGNAANLYYAAQGCQQFIHFAFDQKNLDATKLVEEQANQVLVPDWHTGWLQPVASLADYHRVVCPSKLCYDVLRHQVTFDPNRLTWCRWDAGLAPVKRDGTLMANRLKVAFLCDGTAIDYCGPMVIQLASELLSLLPHLSITMLSSKSWGRRDRQSLKNAIRQAAGRLEVRAIGNLVERVITLHQHDWAVLPAVLTDFGMTVARALACGVPCVVHAVEPFSEYVSDRHNGMLVPCEVRSGVNQAPIAVPSYARWLDICHRAFHSLGPLLSLQRKDWGMPAACAAFDDFWERLLRV